jgi:uncharacterized protein (DUF433 family)
VVGVAGAVKMSSPTTILAIEHIVKTPGICGGKPRVAGRRMKVSEIILWHTRSGWPVEKIAEQFGLTLAQVHAALAYYYDHRDEIEQQIREEQEVEQTLRPDPKDEGNSQS